MLMAHIFDASRIMLDGTKKIHYWYMHKNNNNMFTVASTLMHGTILQHAY
jgi:hypothetical protein